MTDKQQPEALELASVAESADLVGYPTAKKANAYYLCLLEDCAHMIRKLHSENESLRAERDRNLNSIRVNNEIINKKLDENTTLQQGYAAARLEIETLRAGAPADPWRKAVTDACMPTEACFNGKDPAATISNLIDWHLQNERLHVAQRVQPAAPQPGAALPDVDARAQEIRRVDGGHNLGAGALAEALMPFLRASYRQAPAQAATPSELVATMLDALKHAQKVLNHHNLPLECAPINAAILAAKAAPQQAVQEPAYPSLPPADEVVHPRTSEPYALWGLMKLMDYAKAYHAANAPQPSPAARGDALDTERLDFLIEQRAYVVSDDTCSDGYWLRFPVDGGNTSVQIGAYETPREAIDAARAAQKGGA